MAEERTIEIQYVPRDLFDVQLKRIDERYVAAEEISGLRFDKFHAT